MNSNDKKVTIVGMGTLVLMLILSVFFGSSASGDGDGRGEDYLDPFKDHTLYTETVSLSGDLDQGATRTHDIDTTGKLVKNITAILTWKDEEQMPGRPRIRQYNNLPDSFSMTVADSGGNFSESGRGSNPQGGEGSVNLDIMINNTILKDMLDNDISWSVTVEMVEAGMWAPRIGIIGISDPGNSYSLMVVTDYFDLSELNGE